MKKIVKTLIFFLLIITIFFVIAKIIYKDDYIDIIEKECEKYNIDKYVILSIIKAESDFDSDAVSSKKATGLMQLTLDTANWCAKILDIDEVSENDLHNPELNIKLGIYYYNYLFERYNDTNTALAAYNAGSRNVDLWLSDERYSDDGKTLKEIPFEETKNYVSRIAWMKKVYEKAY